MKQGTLILAWIGVFGTLGCSEKEERPPVEVKSAEATPTYDLSGVFEPERGRIIKEFHRLTLSEGRIKTKLGGVSSEGSLKADERETRRLEYLTPSRIAVEISDSARTEERTMSGRIDTQRHQNPLEGIRLLGNKEGSRWIYRLEAGSPSPVVASALSRMTSAPADVDLFEGIQGGIGDSWELDPWEMSVLLDRDWVNVKGKASATLKEIEERGAHRFAMIHLTFNLTGESLERDGKSSMKLKGEGTLTRSLDENLNVSLLTSGDLEQQGSIKRDQETEAIEMVAKFEQEVLREPVR